MRCDSPKWPAPRKFSLLSPRSLAATLVEDSSSRFRPTKGHKNSRVTEGDVPLPTEVEVIDPAHPLYRRRFRESCADSVVRVEWRFGLTLLLPLRAVDIGSLKSRAPCVPGSASKHWRIWLR